jgi:hypothetical protein
MAFSDYSLTPGLNVTIAGINVAENCPAGNINGAFRQLMADGKAMSNTVAAIPAGMPLTGGIFTGDITRSTRGAYRHNVSTALTDGQEYFLPEGSSLPTGAEGRVVNFYT